MNAAEKQHPAGNRYPAMVVILCLLAVLGPGPVMADPYAVVTRESAERVEIEVRLPEIVWESLPESGLRAMRLEGFGTYGAQGSPGIPVKGILIEIPPDGDIVLSAESAGKRTISSVKLAPVCTPALKNTRGGGPSLEKTYVIDRELYEADTMMPGRLAELDSTGFMRGRRVARINVFPVQYNPVSGLMEVHDRIRVGVSFQVPFDEANPELSPKSTSGGKADPFEYIHRQTLLNYRKKGPLCRRTPIKVKAAVSETADEISRSRFAVKLTVETEGMYRIGYEDLAAAGADLTDVTCENIKMAVQGREIAVYCGGTGAFGPGDSVIFYGEPFKSLYTKKNIYWIYDSREPGKRMAEKGAAPVYGYAQQTTFMTETHAEIDNVYWQNIPPYREDGLDHWFWKDFNNDPEPKSVKVVLNGIDRTTDSCAMNVMLRGETSLSDNPDHHTRISLNDSLLFDFTWDGAVEFERKINGIDCGLFEDGDNTITIQAMLDLGVSTDKYYLNWIDISYPATHTAVDDRLKFYSDRTGGTGFAVSGFSDSNVWLFDVSDSDEVVLMTGAETAGGTGGTTLKFEDTVAAGAAYCAVSEKGFMTPAEVTLDEKSDLHQVRSAVDYIIITHEKFYEGIQPLKKYREEQGLTVEIAKTTDIYDEFSDGIKDAAAIRDFLTYAYYSWHETDHPTYVLLVGDASVDYRDDLHYFEWLDREDLVPTYLYQTNPLGDTPTDNWFVCVDGSDYYPDMLVGRLTVKTVEDIDNVVTKIVDYEKGAPGTWNTNVVLSADNADSAANFKSISEDLAGLLPSGYRYVTVYLDDYTRNAAGIARATDDLVGYINDGALIVNYTGHGSVDNWAGEFLFHTPAGKIIEQDPDPERNDMDRLENGGKLPFLITLNCLNGFFPNFTDDYSLAEEWLRSKNKGAVSVLASTALGYPSEHRVLAKLLFEGLFDGNNVVGALVTESKVSSYTEIYSRDVIETFVLFGDPATRIKTVDPGQLIDFGLQEPTAGSEVPGFPPPKFYWGKGIYNRFKIQFSPDWRFPDTGTLSLPMISFVFIHSDQHRPSLPAWFLLKRMAPEDGLMYWRVVAYDDTYTPVEMSEIESFVIP